MRAARRLARGRLMMRRLMSLSIDVVARGHVTFGHVTYVSRETARITNWIRSDICGAQCLYERSYTNDTGMQLWIFCELLDETLYRDSSLICVSALSQTHCTNTHIRGTVAVASPLKFSRGANVGVTRENAR